jgi:hypothetical protein
VKNLHPKKEKQIKAFIKKGNVKNLKEGKTNKSLYQKKAT